MSAMVINFMSMPLNASHKNQGNSIYFLEWQIRPLRKAKKLLGFSLTQKKPTIFRVARLVQGWFDAAS